MKNNKKIYVRPQVSEEVFEANEYVATCSGSNWGVACEVDKANIVEKSMPATGGSSASSNYAANQTHSEQYCGQASHQYITWSDGSGTGRDAYATGMQETDTAQGTLTCTLYTNANYTDVASFKNVKPGSYIYWTTTNTTDGRVWYHQGYVYGHSNRS